MNKKMIKLEKLELNRKIKHQKINKLINLKIKERFLEEKSIINNLVKNDLIFLIFLFFLYKFIIFFINFSNGK
jgi:hypothetical protein